MLGESEECVAFTDERDICVPLYADAEAHHYVAVTYHKHLQEKKKLRARRGNSQIVCFTCGGVMRFCVVSNRK
jgi:hypothetical protein